MALHDEQENQQEITPTGGREASLPPTVNLPVSAKDIPYHVTIDQTPHAERLAAIEEKRVKKSALPLLKNQRVPARSEFASMLSWLC